MPKITKSQAGRVLNALRKTHGGGRPRACECGACPACRQREYRRKRRATGKDKG